MGLINWIRSRILIKAINKTKTPSAVEKSIDFMLADEMKTMTATNRTIDKLLKVKIMRQETQHTLDKIGALDEEFEEEPVEDVDDFENMIKKMLMGKLLGDKPAGKEVTDFGDPLAQAVPQPPQEKSPILDAVNNMTPEELKELKGKFLK